MRKIRLVYLLVALFLTVTFLISGCGQKQPDVSTPTEPAGTEDDTGEESDEPAEEEPAAKDLEPYTFTHYFNYDWWGIKPWGEDEVSKYLSEKFNIHVEFAKPDSDPQAKLNVMISSGDLPDSIMMDRGTDNIRLAQLGLLQPLEPFMEQNPNYQDNVLPQTIELLKIDGKVYGIPNWSRKAASGGNDVWIYNLRLWQDAGSPKLETFEDLYAFAKKIKNDVPKNREGLDTIPVILDSTGDGHRIARAFYRSYGGYINGWYAVIDGKYRLALRDPVFKEATMEANRWWREGLFSESQFTDTGEQILEKIVAGRTALLFYDHSLDETNHFRRILRENFPDDSYEIVQPNPFPPAKGLSPDKIYGDCQGTVGWNVTCITTKAEQPQRIFDLWTYLLTPEAAILQMYGPQGQYWDELDDQGRPILKKPEAELTTDEINKLGLWFWMIPGQSDNVDTMKFAVNDMQPEDKRNWVASTQAHILTPTLWLSDEFTGIGEVIDPQSDEGIQRTMCEDYVVANYPRVIMAETPEEAEKIYQDILDFCDKNGLPAVEELYDKKYQENVKLVGTGLTK